MPESSEKPRKHRFSLAHEAAAFLRWMRREYYMIFRKQYVEGMIAARKGQCLKHGCCDMSWFHNERIGRCLDPKDRTNCLEWRTCKFPAGCRLYPFDEKDKIPETRAYCAFYWEDPETKEPPR